MVETGGSIFIALPLVVMLLSLLPVYILFVRKIAVTAALNVLRVVCIFAFLQYLTLYFIQPGTPALQTAFRLAEFTLVFYLFKLMMTGSQAKDLMNLVLVSFLSVVITVFSLKGITAYAGIITIIEASILTVLSFVLLFQLISNKQIAMPNEPGFWIAGGMLCYFGMVVFMEAIAGSQSQLSQQIKQEKGFIVTVADILRMVFFIVAASIAGKNQRDNDQQDPPPPLPPLPSAPPFKIRY